MNGLSYGIANSWIEQYTQRPISCLTDTRFAGGVESNEDSLLGGCLLWLVVGLVVGNILKGNKK